MTKSFWLILFLGWGGTAPLSDSRSWPIRMRWSGTSTGSPEQGGEKHRLTLNENHTLTAVEAD